MTSLTELEKNALSHLQYGDRVRPVRDWFMLLLIAALFFILSAIWNAWLYYGIVHGTPLPGGTSALPVPDTNTVNQAEAVFAARASAQAKYENSYRFVDPSK